MHTKQQKIVIIENKSFSCEMLLLYCFIFISLQKKKGTRLICLTLYLKVLQWQDTVL